MGNGHSTGGRECENIFCTDPAEYAVTCDLGTVTYVCEDAAELLPDEKLRSLQPEGDDG